MLTTRRVIALLGVILISGILVVGVLEVVKKPRSENGQQAAGLSSGKHKRAGTTPSPYRSLYKQSNRVLDGGLPAFERQLRELAGYPIVVNKWASWCGACRAEHSIFASLPARVRNKVAFVGVLSDDSHKAAQKFLQRHPLPYPSFNDPDSKIADSIGAPANFPITIFYDKSGKRQFIRMGAYGSSRELAADLELHLGLSL